MLDMRALVTATLIGCAVNIALWILGFFLGLIPFIGALIGLVLLCLYPFIYGGVGTMYALLITQRGEPTPAMMPAALAGGIVAGASYVLPTLVCAGPVVLFAGAALGLTAAVEESGLGEILIVSGAPIVIGAVALVLLGLIFAAFGAAGGAIYAALNGNQRAPAV